MLAGTRGALTIHRMESNMQKICALEDCARTTRNRTLCEGHYYQQRRGNPFTPIRTTRVHKPVSSCVVDGCSAEAASHTRPMCIKHETRVRRHGDPNHLTWNARVGADNNMWRGDAIGYGAMHERIRRSKGSAQRHSCVDCGFQAFQWAYDHSDLDEKFSEWGPYSVKFEHYQPMCVPCHKKFDLARLR